MPSQRQMSPQLRAPSFTLVIPRTIFAISTLISFITNPVSSCSCMPPQFPDVFHSADFAAVIKIGEETMVNPRLLQVKELQSRTTWAASLMSTTSRPNLSPPKEPPCTFTQFRAAFSSVTSKKGAFSSAVYDFFNPKVNYELMPRISPVSTLGKTGAPSPHLAESSSGSLLDNKRVTNDHEREDLSSTSNPLAHPISRSKRQQKVYSFEMVNILKVPSSSVRQVLDEEILYTNPGSSCFINLTKNGKYVIWGRIYSGKINLNLCNSLRVENLTEEEKAIISSLQKEPMRQE